MNVDYSGLFNGERPWPALGAVARCELFRPSPYHLSPGQTPTCDTRQRESGPRDLPALPEPPVGYLVHVGAPSQPGTSSTCNYFGIPRNTDRPPSTPSRRDRDPDAIPKDESAVVPNSRSADWDGERRTGGRVADCHTFQQVTSLPSAPKTCSRFSCACLRALSGQ